MDVIPLILTEEVALTLSNEMLERLANCVTATVQPEIKAYLDNPKGNAEVQQKVRNAFKKIFDLQAFMESQEVGDAVSLINNLAYKDITLATDLSILEEYKKAILLITTSDLAVPYIAPVAGTLVDELLGALRDTDRKDKGYLEFIKNLDKYKSLFKDSRYEKYHGTIVKNVLKNRTKYENILRGIDFLIAKKKSGANPDSWRYL